MFASRNLFETDSLSFSPANPPSALPNEPAGNSLGLLGLDYTSFKPQASSYDNVVPNSESDIEIELELPSIPSHLKGKGKELLPDDDEYSPEATEEMEMAPGDDAVKDDDIEDVDPTSTKSIRQCDQRQQGLKEAHEWSEAQGQVELAFFMEQLEFRSAIPPHIEDLLEHATSQWCLPPLPLSLLDPFHANHRLLSLLHALASNPLTVNPDDWADLLVESTDEDDDESKARIYMRFCMEDSVKSALVSVHAYCEKYPADAHRTAALKHALQDMQDDEHAGPVWHTYTGVTCAGLVGKRLDADEKKNGRTRYLNFSTVLRSLGHREKWRIFELVPLQQRLTPEEMALPPSVVRIGANSLLNGWERMMTLVLGPLGWNSAVGGMERGEFIPSAETAALIAKISEDYPLPHLHTNSPPIQPLHKKIATHFQLYQSALRHSQLSKQAGPPIHERAFQQAITNAQAVSLTSRGSVLSVMVQKDISQVAFQGLGRFHDRTGGSGPRAQRELYALTRGFDASDFDESVEFLASHYGPFVDLWCLIIM